MLSGRKREPTFCEFGLVGHIYIYIYMCLQCDEEARPCDNLTEVKNDGCLGHVVERERERESKCKTPR